MIYFNNIFLCCPCFRVPSIRTNEVLSCLENAARMEIAAYPDLNVVTPFCTSKRFLCFSQNLLRNFFGSAVKGDSLLITILSQCTVYFSMIDSGERTSFFVRYFLLIDTVQLQ